MFFSRCTLRCIYCQNYPWSQEGNGTAYTPDRFVAVLRELYGAGCHNWNLVSPTPWLPHIREALSCLKRDGVRLPVLYNTSGFESVQTLRTLSDQVDIYLTDLRYARAPSAQTGSGRHDYVHLAREAIREMWRQKGPLRIDPDGIATQGTVCRLLILPGRTDEVIANLHWLADTFGSGIAVSVMSLYTPAFLAPRKKGWNRRISHREYERVADAVSALDFDTGWMQEYDGDAPDELIGFTMAPGSGI